MYVRLNCFVLILFCATGCKSDLQAGPDPWQSEKSSIPAKTDDFYLPPDLRSPLRKEKHSETKFGFGEWWFKRLLAIVIKSGQVKKSEDGSVEIALQMRFDEDKWAVIDECLKSESTLSDVMFRRAVGYVEDAIYKPTITDKIVMAWSDYIQVYFTEYKTYITWLFGALGAVGFLIWLWKYVSHKHMIVIILALLYIYEVIISYKEAEQQEFEKFMSAMNSCKWYFWTNKCDIPAPDLIVFMKHMNPSKIAIRMITSVICEPIVSINSVAKIIIQDITEGLWFPFDKIVYILTIAVVNISLIYLMIMVILNFIFNIPFRLNLLGIVSIGVKKNRRSLFSANSSEEQAQQQHIRNTDAISGDTLDKILNFYKFTITNAQDRPTSSQMQLTHNTNLSKLKRSASAGRLSDLNSLDNNNHLPAVKNNIRKICNNRAGDGDN